MTVLDEWKNFYTIVGSSAGALMGLQFVVITLIAAKPIPGANVQTGGAFATPTVIHFGVVLFLSAIANVPWCGITAVVVLWGLAGICGMAYTIVTARRVRVQSTYQPVFEDWLFHVMTPFAAYAALAIAAYAVHAHQHPALFLVGAATLTLLFTGIHNAWDAVMYHVFVGSKKED